MKRVFTTRWAVSAIAGALLGPLCLAQNQGPAPLVSPEVSADGAVTFRLRAPSAETVELSTPGDIPNVPFGQGLEMSQKDGVWELTLDSIDPGAYRYSFNVDGLTTLDPSNREVSQSNGNAWSLFTVPGSDVTDTRQVPHGAVAEVHYYSAELDRHRRMHVYTPPGYESGDDFYPVLYLLHGAGDSDDSWPTVGRANFILDNLIASGKAVPMVVVMPDGHQSSRRGGGGLGIESFATEFANDIKPYVEEHYRVRRDRGHTAIAGLSMGGAHTLEISMSELGGYAYIGVFSSGILGGSDSSWQERHAAALDDAGLKRGLELVWFSTGSEDFLLQNTERTVELLRGHGFDVVYRESAGGHTWPNWREYLATFAALLFQ